MNRAVVKKDWLLEQVQSNRSTHRETYDKAMEAYADKVREELENYLERVKNGDVLRIAINLPVPEEHLSDYDRAIKMLENDVRDEIELEDHEFAQLVMDDWGWKQSFIHNTASYAG